MPTAEDEVVDLCRDLIRIDTSNPIKPERPAAEYVAEKLTDVGLQPEIVESEPGRASVVARISASIRATSGMRAIGMPNCVRSAA